MDAPASLLMPATESLPLPFLNLPALTSDSAQDRHYITKPLLEQWAKQNAGDQLRPLAMVPFRGNKREAYRAPQHPTAHVLQSIPPRAPSRSSRSNILSYTLHLATATRLNAYNSPAGSRALLAQAETAASTAQSNRPFDLDTSWLTEELRAQGLWKTSESLLRAQQREGVLPPSVQRRVSLASFATKVLAEPEPGARVAAVPAAVVGSEAVEALQALKPLTSPDSTTLYDVGGAPIAIGGHPKAVAKSLIDQKFSGEDDGEATTDYSGKPADLDAPTAAHPLFGAEPRPSTSTARLTSEPHMDYRIVRGHEMRTRAKAIFAESVLAAESSYWCRRHRVKTCAVCKAAVALAAPSRAARALLPGQGLDAGPLAGQKRALVELVPEFLELSAALLNDLRERSAQAEAEAEHERAAPSTGEGITPTAAWYSLFHALLVQACLEGYLVDGWTGTSAIEVLFGCGCGVWEGKGWASRVAGMVARSTTAPTVKDEAPMDGVESTATSSSGSGSSSESVSDSEDDEAEEERDRLAKEDEVARLIDAAQALFGSREVAQAEFERSMRDRTHEFLNVCDLPGFRFDALARHLGGLNAKYPLSAFEADVVEFLEATQRQLGKPALARYEAGAGRAQAQAGEPDPYALVRYFAMQEGAGAHAVPVGWAKPQASGEAVMLGKRRRD